MKKLAGLVIVLAVLILGGYYGMGVLTERTIKNNVQAINQSNGLLADIEQYNRGWFTSDANIKWRVHVPERIVKDADGSSKTVAAQDFQMDMPIKIYHGPFIFANKTVHFGMGYAQTQFELPAKYNKQFDDMFSKDSMKPKMDLSIFVNYLNRSTVELALPAFNVKAKDGNGTFNWMGMDSSTTMSQNMDKVAGDVVVEGMTFVKDDTKMTLGKVSTDFDLHQIPSGIYLGNFKFTLPSFDVVAKNQKLFELHDLVMSSDSDIKDNLFRTDFSVALKSVLANGKTYGPGDIQISLKNLDADVLAQINQQTTAMQNGTDAERQQAMMALIPELPKLFSKGAEFAISKLSVKLPEGTIEGNLLVSLPRGDSSNPFELIQKIQGNAKLKMPKLVLKQIMQQTAMQQISKQPDMQQALIQQMQTAQPQAATTTTPPPTNEQLAGMQADKQIGAMEQNGLIVVDGSDYAVEVNLDHGKFSVNQKPFEPSMMKF